MSWDNNDERLYTEYMSGRNKYYADPNSGSLQTELFRDTVQESEDLHFFECALSEAENPQPERTAAAQWAIKYGWGLLAAGGVMAIAGLTLPKIGGVPYATAVSSAGAICLTFGYYASFISMVMFASGFCVILHAAYTPSGFDFSEVPLVAYLGSIGLIFIGHCIGRIFGKKTPGL